jgi:predicted  nucleic acid-binding Zn-ribbon protein
MSCFYIGPEAVLQAAILVDKENACLRAEKEQLHANLYERALALADAAKDIAALWKRIHELRERRDYQAQENARHIKEKQELGERAAGLLDERTLLIRQRDDLIDQLHRKRASLHLAASEMFADRAQIESLRQNLRDAGHKLLIYRAMYGP